MRLSPAFARLRSIVFLDLIVKGTCWEFHVQQLFNQIQKKKYEIRPTGLIAHSISARRGPGAASSRERHEADLYGKPVITVFIEMMTSIFCASLWESIYPAIFPTPL